MGQFFLPPFVGLSLHPPLGVGVTGVPPEGGEPGTAVGEDGGGDVGDDVGELVGFFRGFFREIINER